VEEISRKGIVQSAALSLGSWIAQSPFVAALIAFLILAVALGGWGRAFERGRMADGILQAAADNTAKLVKAQEEIGQYRLRVDLLQEEIRTADRKVAESRRKLEEARRVARKEFIPPAGRGELLRRYQALGYRGRGK
jgi:hypothetical protein